MSNPMSRLEDAARALLEELDCHSHTLRSPLVYQRANELRSALRPGAPEAGGEAVACPDLDALTKMAGTMRLAIANGCVNVGVHPEVFLALLERACHAAHPPAPSPQAPQLGARPAYPDPASLADRVRAIMADPAYGEPWSWSDDRADAVEALQPPPQPGAEAVRDFLLDVQHAAKWAQQQDVQSHYVREKLAELGERASTALRALPLPAREGEALTLIAAERKRQVEQEGWTPEHDDEHDRGELARAAACYAHPPIFPFRPIGKPPVEWPWDDEWWKPTPQDRTRELVKAGALIVAEIERLMRATPPAAEGQKGGGV